MSLCLTLAFAGYGLIAAAPVHAHEHHDTAGYAIHAVAQDAVDHDHHFHHDEDHHEALDHHDDGPGDDSAPAEQGGLHVHAVASFTTVSEPSAVPELISTAVVNRAEQSTVRVSGLFVPLKKPPRTFL